MRCQCCNRILEPSEIKYNNLHKRFDFCSHCRNESRGLYDDDDNEVAINEYFLSK